MLKQAYMFVDLWVKFFETRGDTAIKSYNQEIFSERIKRREMLRKEDIKRQKNKLIDI